MASMIARRAALSSRAFSTSARRLAADPALKDETKRNPELFILGGVMVLALGGAGLYFGRTPTSSTSESSVGMAKSGMPWETGATEGKYQYHPGGDRSAEPRNAPSAINVTVIPDVNLPKHLHEKYNKWGKDGY
ncbi:hypothetical protein JX265_008292 [Neoarthrinium moseri]|uniref:Uncharacterized protein n=1 Tax=Neoarthrinium moseri TaxID=1658444 RepID=A0A9P9WIR9_9PEZI|nr:uncharacterized protein JN550_004991 [Neoarthrinium moseri]KAI1851902.1 hypothetical protein JX266_002755 [Neoarthrinium moseri]KAI1865245.1 hypothetical protein JX265_008292 [Neoarthrinium moseri]KAI1870845.1 hypothetical protein JN550_004991 [Neoarthrinium moseri]